MAAWGGVGCKRLRGVGLWCGAEEYCTEGTRKARGGHSLRAGGGGWHLCFLFVSAAFRSSCAFDGNIQRKPCGVPLAYGCAVCPYNFSPFCYAVTFAHKFNLCCVPLVVVLSLAIYPAAVIRAIIPVVVLPVDCLPLPVAVGKRPDPKGFKAVPPFFANRNPTAPVIIVGGVIWICATLNNRRPNPIKAAPCVAVRFQALPVFL